MNFAHGELYMLGAYAGIAVIGVTHSFWVALIAAPILVGVVGAVTEMTTLRPLYNREPLYGLILTFGLALVFREGARQIWGGDMRRILPPFTGSTPPLGMTYPNYRLFSLWMNPQRVAIAIFGIMIVVLIVRPRGFAGREGVLE